MITGLHEALDAVWAQHAQELHPLLEGAVRKLAFLLRSWPDQEESDSVQSVLLTDMEALHWELLLPTSIRAVTH